MKQSENVDHRHGYDDLGKIMFMVKTGGYVMVKRPKCHPFVMTNKEWAKVPKEPNDLGHVYASEGKWESKP